MLNCWSRVFVLACMVALAGCQRSSGLERERIRSAFEIGRALAGECMSDMQKLGVNRLQESTACRVVDIEPEQAIQWWKKNRGGR